MRWILYVCVLAVMAADSAPAQEASTKTLPGGREIIDRYIEAAGGREAVMSCDTRVSEGVFKLPGQGVEGALYTYSEFPDRFVMSIDLGAMGVMKSGFDGETGWMIMPMAGPMLLEGVMLEQMKEQSRMDNLFKDGERVKSLTTESLGVYNGAECYKVKVQYDGWHIYEYYDAETGLLAGFEGDQESPMGTISISAMIVEYREFDGFKIPSKMSQTVMGMEQVFELDKVKCVKSSEESLELPLEIKALKQATPKQIDKS